MHIQDVFLHVHTCVSVSATNVHIQPHGVNVRHVAYQGSLLKFRLIDIVIVNEILLICHKVTPELQNLN